MGVPGHRDATGLSRQTAPSSADVSSHEREGVAGGWKLRVRCAPVSFFNTSKQEAKGGSDKPRPSMVIVWQTNFNELLYLHTNAH
jgi:hypothetical protein